MKKAKIFSDIVLLLSILLLFSLIIRGTARKQREINVKCRYFINDDCAISYQKTITGIQYENISKETVILKGRYLITENKNFKGKGK